MRLGVVVTSVKALLFGRTPAPTSPSVNRARWTCEDCGATELFLYPERTPAVDAFVARHTGHWSSIETFYVGPAPSREPE